MAVTAIIGRLVAIVIPGITELFIQFLIDNTFQKNGHHVPHDRIDILTTFDADTIFFQV